MESSGSKEMLTISMPRGEAAQLYLFVTEPQSYWRDLVRHLVGRKPLLPRESLAARLHAALHDRNMRNYL